MTKTLLIDGNSIMNRAFYGIMGNKMLTTADGKYTNALYGFLAILFKNLEDIKPDYIMIAFDSKTGADTRKKIYDGYKKSRHKMPDELAEQMPEIKEILDAMNIKHIELDDFEGDDILGTFAKKFGNKNNQVYILSGDRDLFQLIDENILVRIPRTRAGKTETEIYDINKVKEDYNGLTPVELIELKALMGDSSDEIPGCPGVGPKTAESLLSKYHTIDNLYKSIENDEDDLKPNLKKKLIENKELVYLSKKLGKINIDAPISDNIDDIKLKEWDNDKIYKLFKYYRFNRFLAKFNLEANTEVENKTESENKIKEEINVKIINSFNEVNIGDKFIYYLEKEKSEDENKIIKKDITGIGFYNDNENYYIEKPSIAELKDIFENKKIEKIGYDLSEDYVILRENGIKIENIKYDVEIATYDIDPGNVKHDLNEIAMQYLNLDLTKFIPEKQLNLFESNEQNKNEIGIYLYAIRKLYELTIKKLEENNSIKLFYNIEIPLISVLGDMQYAGIICQKEKLTEFGNMLKTRLNELKGEIYEIAGEEFNINSTQQLGNILFEKLGLPASKKTKKGYSTDVEALEKIADKNEIVPKILEYRELMKLNSTYVDGLIPYINPKTGRIHSYFHQTITATGRISSTEPNLQNIPSRAEFGKNIKKAFVSKDGYTFIDADYSQVELRVLAHMSNDENMKKAFMNDEDIHREVASQVFNVPFNEVTKEMRSRAKAVNFGIVYGITGFGLGKQIHVSRKEADEYINSYFEKFKGVKQYMNNMVKDAEEKGYVETLFERRRYIPELKSKNYMVREFGKRAAMNTPIQGTAADIMKIAMNNVYQELLKNNIDGKIILQVHDELLLEVKDEQKELAKNILQNAMENAYKLSIPLKVEVTEAKTWYDVK